MNMINFSKISIFVAVLFFTNTAFAVERVSLDSLNIESNYYSYRSSVSGDGRYVAFQSLATNLVTGDTNGVSDIFVRDTQTDTTERISISSMGAQGNADSEYPSISADGRYVAFYSNASNLVTGDTNGVSDIFIHDRVLDTTTRISITSEGLQSNGHSINPSISRDGRYIAFESTSSNFYSSDNNGISDVFVYDRGQNKVKIVSINSNLNVGNAPSQFPSISADGRHVSFTSFANNLVTGDTNNQPDIFVFNFITNSLKRISVSDNGTQANSSSYLSSISEDGRYIAFDSNASNLVAGDTNNTTDIFVYDNNTNTVLRILGNGSVEPNDALYFPSISGDGKYVSFTSGATNLIGGQDDPTSDVYVYSFYTNNIKRISKSYIQGDIADNNSGMSRISLDGGTVTFESAASNLVSGDTNSINDIFTHNIKKLVSAPEVKNIKNTDQNTLKDLKSIK